MYPPDFRDVAVCNFNHHNFPTTLINHSRLLYFASGFAKCCNTPSTSPLPTKISAKDRKKQCHSVLDASGGKLFCTSCNIVVENKWKSPRDKHLATVKLKRRTAECRMRYRSGCKTVLGGSYCPTRHRGLYVCVFWSLSSQSFDQPNVLLWLPSPVFSFVFSPLFFLGGQPFCWVASFSWSLVGNQTCITTVYGTGVLTTEPLCHFERCSIPQSYIFLYLPKERYIAV